MGHLVKHIILFPSLMQFYSRYLIKNTATAITSITHAPNTPPRATGMTLDSWSDFSGSAIGIKNHFNHKGFDKLHEKIPICKLSYFKLLFVFENDFQIPDKEIYNIPTSQLLLKSLVHAC